MPLVAMPRAAATNAGFTDPSGCNPVMPGGFFVDQSSVCEGHVHSGGSPLYFRALGEGPPIIVLHGGPDFNHNYLLPEMDGLARFSRLIYYDQRGRGKSCGEGTPDDVGIDTEVADLENVRRHFGFDTVALLGHSWGGVLAMEYATRHPDRVSELILVNTAPASAEDALVLRRHLEHGRPQRDVERMRAIAATARYRAGDLEAEADYYRIHFSIALHDRDRLERVVERLRVHFTEEDVLAARAIEERLYGDTWSVNGWDLIPKLRALDIPSLVLHGQVDFVPVEVAARIARALPRGRLVVLERCGHFAYLERPDAFAGHVAELIKGRSVLGRH